MMIDKLNTWSYYYNKLPLYMKNSYGIPDHFEMIFDLLSTLENLQIDITIAMNIMQDNYFANVVSKYYDNITDAKNSYDFDLLDRLASLYGFNRQMNVKYYDSTFSLVTQKLNLTNYELYLLIKARIIQNNYDGTILSAYDYYNNIGLPIYVFTDEGSAATVNLYIGFTSDVSDNIKYLFYAGYLTLNSVGIIRNIHDIDISKLGIWALADSIASDNNQWNVSYWG